MNTMVYSNISNHSSFIISVITSVYNTQNYLTESIDSVISQTIGFSKNIQLILVNDGSTDGSEDICLTYQSHFPNNIIYIRKDHSGPSESRNIGLKYAKGKYINFLDSDDRLATDSCERVVNFFDDHYEELSSRAAGISGYIEPRTATPNHMIATPPIESYYF